MQNENSATFFTIISRNYVAHFNAWRRSVARNHPESRVFLILVDEPFEPTVEVEPCDVILAKDVLGDDFMDMAVRYDVLELNTAVKASSFLYIFEKYGPDNLVYLDPDIILYNSINEVLEPLSRGASAVSTPHVFKPLLDDLLPNDIHFLRSGTFNLGFLALARTDEALAFLKWWAARLRFQCFSATAEGLFTDQKWCDLLPSFMPSLAISRHPGANVAYWNVQQRPISRARGGGWQAGGQPLLFFHFSGFSVQDPTIVSRHQNRVSWDDLGPGKQLFLDYRKDLLDRGWEQTKALPYAYAALNGIPLSTPIRRLYARHYPQGLDSKSIAVLNVERLCTGPDRSTPHLWGMSALAAQLLSMRPDIQAKFSVRTPWGRWRFRRWMQRHAAREYNIPKHLVLK